MDTLDLMLDLETMGTGADAVIVQIGACFFDRNTGVIHREFSINVEERSCIDLGLTVTLATKEWWAEQSQEARDGLLDPAPVKLNKALIELVAFVEQYYDVYLWCHPNFDEPKLVHAFKVCGIEYPFNFWAVRDVRTAVDVAGINSRDIPREGVHHNALDDCKHQVRLVSAGIAKINKGLEVVDGLGI